MPCTYLSHHELYLRVMIAKVVDAADDGEEVFTARLVTSAAQAVRRLCTDDPDNGRVRNPSDILLDLSIMIDDC